MYGIDQIESDQIELEQIIIITISLIFTTIIIIVTLNWNLAWTGLCQNGDFLAPTAATVINALKHQYL